MSIEQSNSVMSDQRAASVIAKVSKKLLGAQNIFDDAGKPAGRENAVNTR